jgi:hypothetical protein
MGVKDLIDTSKPPGKPDGFITKDGKDRNQPESAK